MESLLGGRPYSNAGTQNSPYPKRKGLSTVLSRDACSGCGKSVGYVYVGSPVAGCLVGNCPAWATIVHQEKVCDPHGTPVFSSATEGFGAEVLVVNPEGSAPGVEVLHEARRRAGVKSPLGIVGNEFGEAFRREASREIGLAGVLLREDVGLEFRAALRHDLPPIALNDVFGRLRRVDDFDVDAGLVNEQPPRHRENRRDPGTARHEKELFHRIVVASEVPHGLGEMHRASHGNRRDPVRGAAAGHAADGGRHEFGNAVGARDRIGAADAGLSHLDDRELSGTVYEGFAVERHEILGEGVGRLLNARMKAHRTKMQIHETLLRAKAKRPRGR